MNFTCKKCTHFGSPSLYISKDGSVGGMCTACFSENCLIHGQPGSTIYATDFALYIEALNTKLISSEEFSALTKDMKILPDDQIKEHYMNAIKPVFKHAQTSFQSTANAITDFSKGWQSLMDAVYGSKGDIAISMDGHTDIDRVLSGVMKIRTDAGVSDRPLVWRF